MRCTARPEDHLGPDRFAALVQEGRQLSRLQALELAEDVFAMATSAPERRRPSDERDVVRLVALAARADRELDAGADRQ